MGNLQGFRPMRRAAFRLAAWQMALCLAVAVVAAWFGGMAAFRSALIGGGIGIVAGTYQALRMLGTSATADPKRYYRGMWQSEVMKILLTVALFIFALRMLEPRFAPMMVAYASTFFVYWLALGTGFPWVDPEKVHHAGEPRRGH